jgi:hypothetical protein
MRSPKRTPKQNRPRPVLPEVRQFIVFVHSRLKPGSASGDGIWFSRRDDGSLFMDPEEQAAYSALIAALMKTYVPKDDLSRRSVETFVQDALFEALDLRERRKTRFEERLDAELQNLLVRLKAPSQSFTCWIAVDGLEGVGLPARFGDVRFTIFARPQFRQMTRAQAKASSPSWKAHFKRIRESDLWNHTCAVVPVRARDFSAAQELALRRTRQVLDLVNVFSDLIPYNYGWLYLPGDTARAKRIVPIQRTTDGAATMSYTAIDPLTDFSWKKLRAERLLFRLFSRLSTLARKSETGTCGSLLVSAAQWIGRATIDRRREEAFLLYAIALETLILPGEKSGELGYRLKVRVAHLLGRTVATRTQLAKSITRLYGIRSAIVHAGSYEVTDEDLGLLRSVVKRVLFRIVRSTSLHRLTHDQLSDWFDRKILRK